MPVVGAANEFREVVEFWCSTYGGGCGGYFRVKLRRRMNGDFTMVCPNCKHHHNRRIVDGVVTSDRCNNSNTENIIVPKSAWTKAPIFGQEGVSSPNDNADKETAKVIRVDPLLWGRFAGGDGQREEE